MSLPEIKEQFNLQKIISLSDIDSSNNVFNDLTSENLEKIDTGYINSQKNNLDYINSVNNRVFISNNKRKFIFGKYRFSRYKF